MIGTRVSTREWVALASAPLELSISQTAGETFSSKSTAPSPASAGSVRAIAATSATAALSLSIALPAPAEGALAQTGAEGPSTSSGHGV